MGSRGRHVTPFAEIIAAAPATSGPTALICRCRRAYVIGVFAEQPQAEFWYQAFHKLPVIEELWFPRNRGGFLMLLLG